MDKVKNRLSEENIDKELVKLGYPKILLLIIVNMIVLIITIALHQLVKPL